MKPLGSGHLQQPVKFTIEHSSQGRVFAAMSEAAYRTLGALLSRIDEQGIVAVSRAILIKHTNMSVTRQSDAMQELQKDLGFVELVERVIGKDPVYRVLVRWVAKKRDRVSLAFAPGMEPPKLTFAEKRFSALVYVELTGSTPAEAAKCLQGLLGRSRDFDTAKVMTIEPLEPQKAS